MTKIRFFFDFSAKIKKKMLSSSSFDALKKSLAGVHKYIQVRVQVPMPVHWMTIIAGYWS